MTTVTTCMRGRTAKASNTVLVSTTFWVALRAQMRQTIKTHLSVVDGA